MKRKRTPIAEDDPFIQPEPAALMLGVTTQTLGQWRIRGGGPPYISLGAKRGWDLVEWARSKARTSTSAPIADTNPEMMPPTEWPASLSACSVASRSSLASWIT